MLLMHGLSYGPALTRNTKERASGCFSYSAHWLPTRKKTTLHGGQSRLWSAEQEKKKKKKVSVPPPTQLIRKKKKITQRIYMSRRYAGWRYAGLGPSRVRTRIPSTRRLGQWVSLRKILRFRVRSQLSQSRCLSLLLAMSGRVFLFFPPRGHDLRPPSVTASTHTSVFNAIAFQSPAMPNARMSLCTQSVHSFSFPPRPLRTAPSRLPNMIRFGNRPPLIRMSVPAHKSLLVRNVVSMLSHRVISRARLYEVIPWSGLLRCTPMIRSKTRWCTVRSLA